MQKNLIDYIKKRISQKVSESEIIEELKKQGWKIADINVALAEVKGILVKPKLPSPLHIAKSAWILYRSKLKLFLIIQSLPLAVSIIPLLVVIFTLAPKTPEELFLSRIAVGDWLWIIITPLWLVLFVCVSIISQVAMLLVITRSHKIHKTQSVLRKAIGYFFPFLWVSTLSTFIIGGAYFLLFIPGIIYALWFLYGNIILVDQNSRGINAILKSKEYVKGYTGYILIRLLFLAFIFLSFVLLTELISREILLILQNIFPGAKEIFSNIENLLGTAVTYLIIPYTTSYLYIIYQSLKEIKSEVTIPKKSNVLKYLIPSIIGWIIAIAMGVLIGKQIINFFDNQVWTKNIDMLTIQLPLTIYYREHQRYPDSLIELAPKYIEKLPSTFQNPLNYTYAIKNNGGLYDLCTSKDGKEQECVHGK